MVWWAADMASFTVARDKSASDWTMMILLPDWITAELYQRAVGEVQRKKDVPGPHKMRMERYHEGLSAQILHIGSYDAEGPVLSRLHKEWMPQHGYVENGKHHEIYLSDARRVEASKLKTVLRQPVRRGCHQRHDTIRLPQLAPLGAGAGARKFRHTDP